MREWQKDPRITGVVSHEEVRFSAELFMHERRQSHSVRASLRFTWNVYW
jgi:hypothetical protein